MKREEFVAAAQRSGFTVIARRDTKHGTILVAEKVVRDPQDQTKVWETLWSFDQGEEGDVAQVVRNPVYQEKKGVWRNTDTPQDREDRIQEAIDVATRFIEDGASVGRYA